MKGLLYVIASFFIYIITTIIFGVFAAMLSRGNMIIFSIAFKVILIVLVFIGIFRVNSKKKRIFFYKDKLGISIFIVTLILLQLTTFTITKFYTRIIDVKGEKGYSIIKDIKEIYSYQRGFEKNQYGNIYFSYRKNVEPGMDLVKKYIEDAKVDCKNIIGEVPSELLVIKLDYDDSMFKNAAHGENFAGVYTHSPKGGDGQINILVKDAYDDMMTESFRKTLRHELVHYNFHMFRIQNNLELNSTPIWFEEGVAEYIGCENRAPYYEYLSNNIIPFKELRDRADWRKYLKENNYTYQQSHYLICYLVDKKGEEAIRNIMLKTGEMGFEEAFKSVAGASVEDYEEILRGYAAKKWKGFNLDVKSCIPVRNYYISMDRAGALEKYIKENPKNVEAMLDLAHIYNVTGDVKKAIEISELALKNNPKNSSPWYRLGIYSTDLGNYEKAQMAFSKAIELEPKNPGTYQSLAEILLFRDLNKSIEVLEQGVNNVEEKKFLSSVLRKYKKFQIDLKGNEPLNAYLTFIKSDILISNRNKITLIDKALRENPNASKQSENALIALKKKLESQKN